MYDLVLKQGRVIEIIKDLESLDFIWVKIGKEKYKAVNYKAISGSVEIGDQLLLNTTAVELKLGTGGYHFVCVNLSNLNLDLNNSALSHFSPGHIMKMKYTPLQLRTLCAEEEASPYHQEIKGFKSLSGRPVVIIPLHSLLAPLLIFYKSLYPGKKAVYIMSEGGSLSLDFSNLVRELSDEGYLDSTITYGNAFGGDYETVNIFTALATASKVAVADLIIVGMGPGIVGTSTKYGFSGVENAFIEKAVRILKGRTIFVPRVSFADKRKRHYGLSHHTVTLLTELIKDPVELAFPDNQKIKEIIRDLNLDTKHRIDYFSIEEVKEILEKSSFTFKSMGRKFDDDSLFFITAALAVYKI